MNTLTDQEHVGSKSEMQATLDSRGREARILIVDDHELLRDGMRILIGSEPGFNICGEAGDERTALAMIRSQEPDLVVLDLTLASGNGLTVAKWIRQNRPKMKIVISTMHEERLYGERALRAGAHGYVHKQAPARTIIKAIHHVLDGQMFFSEQLTNNVLRRLMSDPEQVNESPVEALSDRELEVFRAIGDGLTTSEIAAKLKVSTSTVATYRERLKNKLNLRKGVELTHVAIQWVMDNP